ncbi:unnamed protein product [Cylindrotheca closterium]|uniref:HSF-type DNA-binding domain-containing protein n=1 Tax=Cylindrotheca closterium TaxID=2856 RepID=A0AAD2CUB0_9STRA|nr:unnamed protein product [Cylindrotheca closterium]
MDVDARTQETAAALLGVAMKRHQAPPPAASAAEAPHNINDSLQRWGTRDGTSASSAPSVSSPAPAVGVASVPQASAPTAGLMNGANPVAAPAVPRAPPSSHTAGAFVTPQPSHIHMPQHASAESAAASTSSVPLHTRQAQQVQTAPNGGADANTVLSMSSIGFGIDSSAHASWGNATEAASRALQDAMERSTLRLPMTMPAQHLLQIKVQLGVPPKQPNSTEPMNVDLSRLTSILPRAIPVLPIRVDVGGLFMRGETQGSPSICTAVACITLQSRAPLSMSEQPVARAFHSVPAQPAHPQNPWTNIEVHPSTATAPTTTDPAASKFVKAPSPAASSGSADIPHAPASISSAAPAISPPPQNPSGPATAALAQASPLSCMPSASPSVVMPLTGEPRVPNGILPPSETINAGGPPPPPPPPPRNVRRNTSIEMLAMISEEIRLAGDKNGSTTELTPNEDGIYIGLDGQPMVMGEDGQLRNGNYNYKKLPPGVTTKNNRRLFVKHSYRDHSSEKPLPEEKDLTGVGSSTRTPNAAFPLKLHETLTQIENDGHDDIIGWMPHGRSFKIHKQKEFAEIILPRYFVMTKKSSFLRQLNLYGFNRFSAGPDQGSYYHEKFLRGMKFLCRRMTRQKVNGNRIRSAGNPDEEPVLSSYPQCPDVGSTIKSPSGTMLAASPSAPNGTSYSPQRSDGMYVDNPSISQDFNGTGTSSSSFDSTVVSFPLQLQRMLDKLEADGNTGIISWLSHGRAFIIHDPDAFAAKIMPLYFHQSNFSYFQRQLQLYRFQQFTSGPDTGAYFHSNFQRGMPHLCARVARLPRGSMGGASGIPNAEPNLYAVDSLPAIERGSIVNAPSGKVDLMMDDGNVMQTEAI